MNRTRIVALIFGVIALVVALAASPVVRDFFSGLAGGGEPIETVAVKTEPASGTKDAPRQSSTETTERPTSAQPQADTDISDNQTDQQSSQRIEEASAAPQVTVPSFGLLRVEPDGSVVIAGQAGPNADVEVLAGSNTLATAKAQANGDFVAVLDTPLEPGDYEIVLRSTGKDGSAMSAETAIVSVPEKGKEGEVLALVEKPGQPSRLITKPEPGGSGMASAEPKAGADSADGSAKSAAGSGSPAAEDTASAKNAGTSGQSSTEAGTTPETAVAPDAEPATETASADEPAAAPAKTMASKTEEAPASGAGTGAETASAPLATGGGSATEGDVKAAGKDNAPADAGTDVAAKASETDPPSTEAKTQDLDQADAKAAGEGGTASADAADMNAPAAPKIPGDPGTAGQIASGTAPEADAGSTQKADAKPSSGETSPEKAARPSDAATAPQVATAEPDATDGNATQPAAGGSAVEPAQKKPEMPKSSSGADSGPDVRIEAVEIDGKTVFVAGTSDPGTHVRVYANDILLGDTVTTAGGSFLVQVDRDLPVGDYIVRADVIDPATADVLARAAVPFSRAAGERLAAVAVDEGTGEPAAGEDTATPAADASDSNAGQTRPVAGNQAGADGEAQAPSSPPASGTTEAQPNEMTAADKPSPETPAATKGNGNSEDQQLASTAPREGADGSAAVKVPMDRNAGLASPPELSSDVPVTVGTLRQVDSSVIIRRGDTLWQISRRVYGHGIRYTTIYLANEQQIRNPDLIFPGQIFSLPSKTERNSETSEEQTAKP